VGNVATRPERVSDHDPAVAFLAALLEQHLKGRD
jgi:hypothetical protein